MKINLKINPLISEKSTKLAGEGWYSFKVPVNLDKKETARILEDIFKVKVIKVNSAVRQAKVRRTKGGFGKTKPFKKIFIKLKKGQKIDMFDVENSSAKG